MENRREFLRKMSGLTAAMMLPLPIGCNSGSGSDALGQILPLRKLGATGEKVTMLGVGGYHIGWTEENLAQQVIETAIEGGIRFFDTAHNYGKGESEIRYGKYLIPKYRDHIFLMTKTQAKTGEALLKEVDLSLSRMGTDQVDLLQLHSFKDPEDVDERIANGVMDAIYSIREAGKARHIGFTGHASPYAHLKMMEQLNDYSEFATLQMPLNVIDYNSDHSFVKKTLPLALDHKLGILAMKTLADGRFFNKKQTLERVRWESENPVIPNHVSIKEALYFVWSLPVSVLITGAENSELLKEKIELANSFMKFSEEERLDILERAGKAEARDKVEYYKKV
jgi:aryl-alcohol dehydrogenase-like predicted oxidoreductase